MSKTVAFFWSLLMLFISFESFGDHMKRIMRLLKKADVEKAVAILHEGLHESPDHPGYLWLAADLNATDSLPCFNIDSAFVLVKKALESYENISGEQLEDFEKVGFNKQNIMLTDEKIRKLQWKRTQELLTIEAIAAFRNKYPEAPQDTEAIFLRDSLAYIQTKNLDTWKAYQAYIQEYPQSAYYKRALDRYEALLYKDMTADGTLESFESFVDRYPSSPFREEAIGYIFDFKLFWNEPEPLIDFVHSFPESKHIQTALDYLYHLDPLLIRNQGLFLHYKKIDSLRAVDEANQSSLFLYPGSDKINAFIFQTAALGQFELNEVLGKGVYCDPYNQDYLAGAYENDQVLMDRLGHIFFQGSFDTYKEVGFGVILINDGVKGMLLHKNGDLLLTHVEDAGLIGKWMKVKRNGKWALFSLNGTFLSPFEYDRIEVLGNFWVFEKNGLFALTNKRAIDEEVGSGGFTLMFKYDDLELIDDEWMIGFKGKMEGLINDQMEFIIPWATQTIYPNKQIPYSKRGSKYSIYPQLSSIQEGTYENVLVNNSWLALHYDTWQVYSFHALGTINVYDSVRLIGDDHLFVSDTSGSFVLFDADSSYQVQEGDQIRVLSKDDESYVLIENEEIKSIYASDGCLLLSEDFKDIKLLGDSLFAVTSNKKLGVVDHTGAWLVDDSYDFISKNGDVINLLESKKIGAYIVSDSVLIEPGYTSNVEAFGSYFLTSNESGYGLLDAEGVEVISFSNLSLDYFSDSLMWVKTDSSWQVQKIIGKNVIQFGIRSFESMDEIGQNIFRVSTSSGYGLLDENGGYLIPPTFSDIRVVEDGQNWIFVCEKAVPEASFYIWVGYDKDGQKLFSEAYREERYDRFSCD
jgi:hypothetical protein